DEQAIVEEPDLPPAPTVEIPDDCYAITAATTANIWQILVKPGDRVTEETGVIILEAMKQEMTLLAEAAGVVTDVLCTPGQLVTAGQILAIVRSADGASPQENRG
ncbi:MAG: hypothetical protein H7Z11_12695, partial [Verrucomicrobia bacterium]|nr:hypothetical protein [Leptolyngbya sp. ES-bin-22]